MKTINQVLLALIFVAFSTVGFAQSQTTLPEGTVKRVVDYRYQYIEVEDEEEDDDNDNDDGTVITKEEWNSIQFLIPRKGNAIIYEGDSNFMPNQM